MCDITLCNNLEACSISMQNWLVVLVVNSECPTRMVYWQDIGVKKNLPH